MGVELRQRPLPGVLRAIGRKLLNQFLAHFQSDLAARHITLPRPDIPDDDYFHQLTDLLSSEAELPDRLTQALFTVEEMASPEGQERLQAAVAHAGLKLTFDEDSSPEGLTVQVWLEAPGILDHEHRKHDVLPLTSFECFGSTVPKNQRAPFVPPDHARLQALSQPLVQWFAQNHHAVHTTRIEYRPKDRGQHWFHVRHGDTCRWTRKIGDQKTEFIQFALEDHETMLYAEEDDDLWISARTAAERELYRQHFGLSLRGSLDYFSEARNNTLEPLRTEGADALDPGGIEQIRKIHLRQIQVKWKGGFHEFTVTVTNPDEVFKCASAGKAHHDAILRGGTITRAAFLIQLADSPWCRAVEICLPDVIKLERPGDLLPVAHWARKRGLCLPRSLTTHDLAKAA